jgi:hypothetical protein
MYINNTQAETVFYLIAREDEKLSLGEYRLNFLASREELVELMEKMAPVIKIDNGWADTPEFLARVHRLALDNDLAEKRAKLAEAFGVK